MQLLTEFRIFADHYQFFVYDVGVDPCPESFYSDPEDNRSDIGSYRLGYLTNGRTICFGTEADSNDHWIEVYSSSQVPNFGRAERVIALPLKVDSGRIGITNLLYSYEPIQEVAVDSGVWTAYLLAFNIGSDKYWDQGTASLREDSEVPSDEQLKANWEFERYQIILVPDFQTPIGVLHRTAMVGGA
jgi:hypothetical protein